MTAVEVIVTGLVLGLFLGALTFVQRSGGRRAREAGRAARAVRRERGMAKTSVEAEET